MKDKVITIKSIARAFERDKSNIFKYIKKNGLSSRLVWVRSDRTNGQPTLALLENDAIFLCKYREKDGFTSKPLEFDLDHHVIENHPNH